MLSLSLIMFMVFFSPFYELKLILYGIWEMMVDGWFWSFEIVPKLFWEPAPSMRIRAVAFSNWCKQTAVGMWIGCVLVGREMVKSDIILEITNFRLCMGKENGVNDKKKIKTDLEK